MWDPQLINIYLDEQRQKAARERMVRRNRRQLPRSLWRLRLGARLIRWGLWLQQTDHYPEVERAPA
jgi:hypothetical protein